MFGSCLPKMGGDFMSLASCCRGGDTVEVGDDFEFDDVYEKGRELEQTKTTLATKRDDLKHQNSFSGHTMAAAAAVPVPIAQPQHVTVFLADFEYDNGTSEDNILWGSYSSDIDSYYGHHYSHDGLLECTPPVRSDNPIIMDPTFCNGVHGEFEGLENGRSVFGSLTSNTNNNVNNGRAYINKDSDISDGQQQDYYSGDVNDDVRAGFYDAKTSRRLPRAVMVPHTHLLDSQPAATSHIVATPFRGSKSLHSKSLS